jgi:hypothetical protein
MLVKSYNWFTECFDSADLKEAKALLDELSRSDTSLDGPPFSKGTPLG